VTWLGRVFFTPGMAIPSVLSCLLGYSNLYRVYLSLAHSTFWILQRRTARRPMDNAATGTLRRSTPACSMPLAAAAFRCLTTWHSISHFICGCCAPRLRRGYGTHQAGCDRVCWPAYPAARWRACRSAAASYLVLFISSWLIRADGDGLRRLPPGSSRGQTCFFALPGWAIVAGAANMFGGDITASALLSTV